MTRLNPALDARTVVNSLQRIMPPTTLIHVGVGRGTGTMHQWHGWDVPAAWLIDAEPAQLVWTERLLAAHPGWQAVPATLAEVDGKAMYYRASNLAESGLLPINKLTSLWPNLRETEHNERATTRLDTLITNAGEAADSAGWWLIVDCLPALRVLQGAPDTIERCSVLWLRALLQPLPDAAPGTTLEELKAFLAPLGFRCVQVTESNHPALGETLFVRDWAQCLRPVIANLHASTAQQREQNRDLNARLAAEAKRHAELADQLAHLERERAAIGDALNATQSDLAARNGKHDEQAKLAAERQSKIDAFAKEKSELVAKLEQQSKAQADLAGKLAALEKEHRAKDAALKTANADTTTRTAERDTQAKLLAERQAQLDALSKEMAVLTDQLSAANTAKQDLAKRGDALQGQVDGLTKARDEQAMLASDHTVQLTQLTAQRDKLSAESLSLKSELQARDGIITKQNEQIAEQDQRERQLIEEIVRAEGQIELIKDLLLREGGL